MATYLKVTKHLVQEGNDMIEVWDGNKMIGGLYIGADRSIRVISKHTMNVHSDASERDAQVTTITFAED